MRGILHLLTTKLSVNSFVIMNLQALEQHGQSTHQEYEQPFIGLVSLPRTATAFLPSLMRGMLGSEAFGFSLQRFRLPFIYSEGCSPSQRTPAC